jgi:simple sugar transport system substrate-binding protein
MKNTRHLLAVILAVTVLALTSCSKEAPQGGTQQPAYNFTLVFFSSPGNPFWTKIISGAEEMAKALNCKVNMQFAYNDPVKQNDIIETAVSNKIDGLGIVINTDEAYNESVKKAIARNVPVIAFNLDHSRGKEGNARMAYIGLDYVRGGEIVAKRLVQDANLKAGDHVVCPVEHPDAIYSIQQYQGIKKIFEPLGITSEVLNTGSTSLEESLNRLTQYLLGHKNTTAILAMGGMPMEVAPQAIKDASMNIPNIGFDITKEILKNIMDGKTIAALEQEPFYQGAFTVMQLYYYKKYGLMPCDVCTGPVMIDKTNAAACFELADTVR